MTGKGRHRRGAHSPAPPESAGRQGRPLDPAVALENLRGPGGYPPGFYGSVRQRLPIFAAVGALGVLVALIPFPYQHQKETLIAGGVFFLLTALAITLPWRRLPSWFWPVIPIGYIGVIALLYDAQGGASSGLVSLYFLPIVWLAFYGRRWQVIAGLIALAAAMIIPVLVVGPPAYPDSQWRLIIVTLIVATLIAFSFLTMVGRDRAYVADMAEQSLIARENARQAHEAREQLDSLLRAATETAVIGSDDRGYVMFFSAGAERMFGYRADEVVRRVTPDALFEGEELAQRQDELQQLVNTAAARGTAGESVWTFLRKDGTKRRCALTITSQRTAGRGGFVMVAHDVTEREQLAAERERLLTAEHEVTEVLFEQNHRLRELTQMKDDLVATVSHELRTPLTSIMGFVELLVDGSGTMADEQIRMLQTIDRNSRQLMQVADDLLADLSGGYRLRVSFVDVDLSSLAREAVESMAATAATRGVHLAVHTNGPVLIRGDISRLHQLFANLLTNALKFTPGGGRVEVHVVPLGLAARVEVLDDGPGIPPEEREQLFERFYRLASSAAEGIPGAGLGLAIAKAVVEAHEGTIEIVDTPGWSTTFRIHLPLSTRQQPDTHVEEQDPAPTNGSGHLATATKDADAVTQAPA